MFVLAQLQLLRDATDERRRTPRLLLKLEATLGSGGSRAVVHDLSETGLLFHTAATLPGDRVDVHIPGSSPAPARVVWNQGRFYGCEFDTPISSASVSAALLRSEPRSPAGRQTDVSGQLLAKPAEQTRVGFGRGWNGEAVAGVAILVGAVWLALNSHIIALVAALVVLALFLALLAACLIWGLDNEIFTKF